MKLLGIDYGRRRIGIATTDETGICIRGCPTIDRKKCPDSVSALSEIIDRESPEALVFGVPLGPHDEETVMSREIRIFAERIHTSLPKKLPIHFVDESYSSILAQRQLQFLKKKKRRDKQLVDKLAACNILETFQRQQECDHL